MRERLRQFGSSRAVAPLLLTAGLLSLAIYFHGWPLNIYTWLVLAVILALSALPAFVQRRKATVALALLLAVYIAFPGPFMLIPVLERWSLCDDHGGRRGWEISPMLRFGRDGPNTELLESYLGPLPANWWQQAPHFPYIRDGNERVQSRNPIRREYLPEMLARLPNDAARKQVLTCLVDTENRLRVHQGLLLACVMDLGYPPGLNAEGWWQAHQEVFRPEHDPIVAAKMTRGWLRRIRRLPVDWDGAVGSLSRAADYQERGAWGGHEDFGEAVRELEWRHRPRPVADSNNVVWWPSATEAAIGASRVSDVYLIRPASGGSPPDRVPMDSMELPEYDFSGMFDAMVLETNPDTWPLFGKFGFKLDGCATEVTILEISDQELGVQVGDQIFRGLDKSAVLRLFRQ